MIDLQIQVALSIKLEALLLSLRHTSVDTDQCWRLLTLELAEIIEEAFGNN